MPHFAVELAPRERRTTRRVLVAGSVAAMLLIGCGLAPDRQDPPSSPAVTNAPRETAHGPRDLCIDSAWLGSLRTSSPRITDVQPPQPRLGDTVAISFNEFKPDTSIEVQLLVPGSEGEWPPVAGGRTDSTGSGVVTFVIPANAPVVQQTRTRGLACVLVVIRPADTRGVYVTPSGEPLYAVRILPLTY